MQSSVTIVDFGFVEQATEIVVSYLDQTGFSGNDLASHLHLSREQTHRKLKRNTNLSTGKFIRFLRLLKAYEYARQGRYSMAEISYKVGFDSPAYFSKCFKEEWGISPGEVRKTDHLNELTQTSIYAFYQLPAVQKVLSEEGIHLNFPIKNYRNNSQKKVWIIAGIPVVLLVIALSNLFLTEDEQSSIVAIPDDSRIAVIPLTNQTGDSLMNQVGDIASSWISSQLDELPGVKTVPFFTIQEYQTYIGILPNDPDGRPTFSEVVGARYFVTGNYFLKGQRLYMDTRLLDAQTQESIYHLPVVEGPKDSVMQIIENLRLKIAGLVTNLEEVKLGKLTPPNYEAYKNYLSGLTELKVGKYPSNALRYFEKAVELEPNFVMARLFTAWFYQGEKVDSVVQLIGEISNITEYERNVYLELHYTLKRDYPAALEVTLRSLRDYPQDYYFNMEAAHLAKCQFMPQLALNILSRLSDPLNSDVGLLWHYFKVWNYTESLVMLGKYEEALGYLESIPTEFHNPAIPGLFLYVYAHLGRPKEEAEAVIERFSKGADNLYAEYYTSAAYEFGVMGDHEVSRYFAQKAIPLMQKLPEHRAGTYGLIDALYLAGNLSEARNYIKNRLKENTGFPNNEELFDAEYYSADDFLVYLANVEAAMGHADEAEKIFASLKGRSRIYWRRHEYRYRIEYLKARMYAQLDRKEEAMKFLNQALAEGQLHHHWDFENDIFLKPLFDYPPFQTLVQPREYADITVVP